MKLFISVFMEGHLLVMRRTNQTVPGKILYWNRLEAVSVDPIKKKMEIILQMSQLKMTVVKTGLLLSLLKCYFKKYLLSSLM